MRRIRSLYNRLVSLPELEPIPMMVFFGSIFIFLSFAGTRLFFSDEGIILDQFYNLIHGSLALKIAKINVTKGVLVYVNNHLYGIFSYSLLILSVPVYYLLSTAEQIYGAHLFILQLWALSGGCAAYFLAKSQKSRFAGPIGIMAYLIMIYVNLQFFRPIDFPKWGELLSIEFTNIIISSFLILLIYMLFKNHFGTKIALFASFFAVFATPISFYAITLKHHVLTLFFTVLSFYLFDKYNRTKENVFLYLAYVSAGLCVWTRVMDGVILLASLLLADIFILRRGLKQMISVSIICLIGLTPFFVFNYLILGSPFSVIETYPLSDEPVKLITGKDFITLDPGPESSRQAELFERLGYVWDARIRGDWYEILGYALFFRLINTFGIFVISPFLILAIAFIADRLISKIKLNVLDKFLALYILLFFGAVSLLNILGRKILVSIITDTPVALEYRYLLIMYIVLLYFVLRINKIRELIETRIKTLTLLYGAMVVMGLIYFIMRFPLPFLDLYYYASLGTSVFLLIILSLAAKDKFPTVGNNLLTLGMALTLAEATMLLLFYYWVVSMTYISPSQNHIVVPIMGEIINWMYQAIF